MDHNVSNRRSNEDTATSMYLSFDAESTMSTACYKTLEAMSDISVLSCLSTIEDASDNTEDKHMNSTLENNQDSVLSPMKTVRKMEVLTTNSPLRALPKNILREYKAMSSTPSKEQLLKSVDVTRGSDATRCIDLGIAFLGVEDEQPALFPPPLQQQRQQQQRYEDNKENAMPESGNDGSTLSVSSSVEIATSVIEKKRLNSASTVDESLEELKVLEIVEEIVSIERNLKSASNVNNSNEIPVNTEEIVLTDPIKDKVDTTPASKLDSHNKIDTIEEDIETPEELTPIVHDLKEIKKAQSTTKLGKKPGIAVLTSRNARRSVCEPNLQTNKPSRISTAGFKRQSLLPVTKKTTTSVDVEKEIPLLMSKMLKISNTSMKDDKDELAENKNNLQANEKRRSAVGNIKGRMSLKPPTLGEKRPFSFTQRMSVIVKTTLNSPARKIARKSILGTSGNVSQQQQRRSMMNSRLSQTTRSNKAESSIRRSMIPNSKTVPTSNTKTTTTNTTTLTTLKEATTQQRKSLYPAKKCTDETATKQPLTTSSSCSSTRSKNQETIFTCNSCKEKFRIKSLLDAHRRSHEGDDSTPILNKKPTTSSAVPTFSNSGSSLFGKSNQCKYCDKKFALVRALHIHLLQNCLKIPPSEKRKLQFTEMNHVEKARLPNVFHHGNGIIGVASSIHATPRVAVKPNISTHKLMDIQSSTESGIEKELRNKSSDSTTSNTNGSQPPTQAAAKSKKASAHSGVYRTPSKTVPCHLCKLTFKSILDYTNHSLATHGYKAEKNDLTQQELE